MNVSERVFTRKWRTKSSLPTNKSEEWADYSYGSDGTQTLSDNGCAPLSLFNGTSPICERDNVSPLEVLGLGTR